MKKHLTAFCLVLLIAVTAAGQSAQLQEGLSLKYLVQLPAKPNATSPVVILLHGYGSNEQDLFELKSIFPTDFIVIAARAPYTVGLGAYQWFEIGAVSSDKTAQVTNSSKLITTFIAQILNKYHTTGKVYLVGFSQGAMMSYQAGLTNPDKIAGIAVLSGKLFPSLKHEVSKSSALKELKIFISHGTADNRIPFAEGKATYDYLKSIGLSPQFHQYAGMGHSINNDVLTDLQKWFSAVSASR